MGRKSAFKLDVVSVRLVKDASIFSDREIHFPEDAIHLVGNILCEMDREMVCVINVRTDGVPINCTFAGMGAVNYCMGHPRELLKASILSNASTMILVHNHPSGNLVPSKDDVRLTDRLQKVCELIGIPLVDHIIVGGDNRNYFSFKGKGMISNPVIQYQSNYQYLDWENPMIAEKGKRGR